MRTKIRTMLDNKFICNRSQHFSSSHTGNRTQNHSLEESCYIHLTMRPKSEAFTRSAFSLESSFRSPHHRIHIIHQNLSLSSPFWKIFEVVSDLFHVFACFLQFFKSKQRKFDEKDQSRPRFHRISSPYYTAKILVVKGRDLLTFEIFRLF